MSKLLQESGELCSLFSRNPAKLADVWCLELCAGTLFVLLLKFGAVLRIICGYEWLFDGSFSHDSCVYVVLCWIFHASCAFKFSCGLPPVSLCLSDLFPLDFLLWAPPPPLPHLVSSLLSLLTCSSLVISVCVFSLWVSLHSLSGHCICLLPLLLPFPLPLPLPLPLLLLSPHGKCSLDLDFCFSDVWFELWFFSVALCLAVFCCCFASRPSFVCFWFLYSAPSRV